MSAPADIFPALDNATEKALRASIERFGVLVPVAVDQNGRILDGKHRSRIAAELGVEYRTDVHEVESDEQAREIAVTLNADRRRVSPKQRKEVVAALREDGHSQRAIAAAVGVSKRTVEKDLEEVATGSHLPDEITGQDGKTYPATKKPEPEPEPEPETTSLTQRQIYIAKKNRERVEMVVGACQAYTALSSLNVDHIRHVSSSDDMDGWVACIQEGAKALTDFAQKIKANKQGV